MSQTLLAFIGVAVFLITVCATLIYGYYYLDQLMQADASQLAEAGRSRATAASDGSPLVPEVTPTSPVTK